MSYLEEEKKFHSFHIWFNSKIGKILEKVFINELVTLQTKGLLGGERLLQLGGSSNKLLYNFLTYKNKWQVTPDLFTTAAHLKSSFFYLPFAKDTFDCIIAPLTMCAFSYDNNPLNELNRVLKSMGSIVFLGVNNFSLLSLVMRFKKMSCFGESYTNAMGAYILRQNMQFRGYQQSYFSNLYLTPTEIRDIFNLKITARNSIINLILVNSSPFYCLVMQKLQTQLTKIQFFTARNEEARNFQPACQVAQKFVLY